MTFCCSEEHRDDDRGSEVELLLLLPWTGADIAGRLTRAEAGPDLMGLLKDSIKDL